MTGTDGLVGVLGELGWKPEALARRLNELAVVQGRTERLHAKTPYKWLQGDQPRSPWPALTAALLTDELGRSIGLAELGWSSDDSVAVPASSGLLLPWTVAGSLQALRVVTHSGGMDRRILLTLLGAAGCAPAHEWLLARPDVDAALAGPAEPTAPAGPAGATGLANPAEPTVPANPAEATAPAGLDIDVAGLARSSGAPVPMAAVDCFDEIVGHLRRMDDLLGSGTLLGLVQAHLRQVVELLEQHRYTEAVGRRLHATAGELLRLAGWLSFDGGLHPTAQRYWVAALHAAHAAGDRALGANIIGFMSMQAYDLGQIRESVTLAETGRAGYPGATPRVAAICDLRAAVAHAYDHATTECRRALDAALDRIGNSPSSSGEPGWCYWLDEAQAHTMAGCCYLQLADWGRARQHLRTAIRLQNPNCVREGAQRDMMLAETYLRQDHPDVDHAVDLTSRAVDTLGGEVDSARMVGQLTQLIGRFAPYRRRSTVRQLTDQAVTAGLLKR